MSLAKGFFSPSVLSILAVRVLDVIIKFVLFHQRVGDELQSNLLELGTHPSRRYLRCVLVSDDQFCRSCSDDDLLRGVGLLKLLLIHLHQRADAGRDRVVPCLVGRWGLVRTPLRPACCRENTGQLISRILRQMSRSQLRMRRVTVLLRLKVFDEIHTSRSQE